MIAAILTAAPFGFGLWAVGGRPRPSGSWRKSQHHKNSGFEAGASALWLAVHGNRIDIARALIEAGAEVDFKGRGASHLKAVYNGRLAIARLLLDCSSSRSTGPAIDM